MELPLFSYLYIPLNREIAYETKENAYTYFFTIETDL